MAVSTQATTLVKELSDQGADGSRLGTTSLDKISFLGKAPVSIVATPTVVLSVDPTVSTSTLVASIQSLAVYAASQVNLVILAMSKYGLFA